MARNGVKTGGRQLGSVNKKTAEEKDRAGRVLSFIEKKFLLKDIKALTPHQRMMLYADMMEYKAPKLSRTTIDAGDNGTIKIVIKRKTDAEL
jgi:hypothetical protein